MELNTFVQRITENLKNNGASEEKIKETEEKLKKKYFALFQTEINDYTEIVEDKTEDRFFDLENQTEEKEISVKDFSVFENHDEYDTPAKREKRIQAWSEHYENIQKEKGILIFDPEEKDNIDERGEFGRTMLHQAVIDKDKEKIRELIEKGIDHTITDNSGITPFLQAVLDEDTEIIRIFKDYGIKK